MRKCSDVGHSDPGGSSGDSELLDESQRRLRQDFLVSCMWAVRRKKSRAG